MPCDRVVVKLFLLRFFVNIKTGWTTKDDSKVVTLYLNKIKRVANFISQPLTGQYNQYNELQSRREDAFIAYTRLNDDQNVANVLSVEAVDDNLVLVCNR